MTDELERAREELRRASDAADGELQTNLDSVQEGIGEELEGHRTQDEPGPKDERVLELTRKLDELADKTEGDVAERVTRAREHCLAALGEER